MPTLRSQYQHVKPEFHQAELGDSNIAITNLTSLQCSVPVIPGLSPMTVSPSKNVLSNGNGNTTSCNNGGTNLHSTVQAVQISPVGQIINVSSSSSDDEPSLTSSSSRHDSSRGSSKKGNIRNKRNSRKSSRRSSGSVCETDILNTATIHITSTTQNDASIYTSSSLPTLLTQSDYNQYANFQAYKHNAEQAIMQSLHVQSRLPVSPYENYDLPNVHSLNHPLYNQSNYIPLLMESRGGMHNHDSNRVDSSQEYHTAHSSQSSLRTQEDINSDDGLRKVLDQNGCFETKEGMQDRAEIVKSLDLLAKQWIRTCGLEKGFDYTVVEKNQGMVLTYGSCKLEAADKDADMDLICIAPHFVNREEFFTKMYKQLQKHSSVQELRKLPDVFVPVIKFKFNDTEIDFTFARLNKTVPENEEALLDDAYTRNLDDRCVRSLNGYRATCQILTLVPDVKVFQVSLRAMKLWGKNNGVYGNILGYLGGASWAILVARTCQEQAKKQDVEHCPKEVIFTFFQMYSNWKWPAPVYISLPRDQTSSAWNPSLNPADRDHCMPIITSSAPQMNSAVNINHSVQRYIQERMKEASHICQQIQAGNTGWEALFKAFPFYQEYEEYIKITGQCETDACFWFGCLESKLRYLKEKIESNPRIKSVRIWPKGFITKEKLVSVQTWFIGFAGSGSHLESYIEDDLNVFTDRCHGDLKRAFGSNSMANRVFSVTYKVIRRADIFNTLTLKELKKTITYASVTQGVSSSRAPTPPVVNNQRIAGMSNVATLHCMSSQPLNYPSLYNQSTNTQTSTVTSYPSTSQTTVISQNNSSSHPTLANTHQGHSSNYNNPNVHSVPLPVHPINPLGNHAVNMAAAAGAYAAAYPFHLPYYHQYGLYHPGHEALSPKQLLVPNSRTHSPRSGASSRNQSPNYSQRNSPNQFIFSEGAASMGPYIHSPTLQQQQVYAKPNRTFSPNHQTADRNFLAPLGPFSFPPPPVRPLATTPPPSSVHTPRTIGSTPPQQHINQPTFNFVNRRPDYFTAVVSGVTSINNNNKKIPCVSIVEPEAQKEIRRPLKAFKESTSEDDRLRSVSNSSDTIPPSVLYRSRINHQDAPPPSPFPAHVHYKQAPFKAPTPPSFVAQPPPLSPSNSTHSLPALVPLSQADVSVPPPLAVSAPDSPHSTQDSSGSTGLTFSSIRGGEKPSFKGRIHRSPRLSISELNDAASPRPVQYKHKVPIGIKVNMCSSDDVFK